MSTRTISKTRGGVGESVRRIDGIPKVKGTFLFGSDLWADEMLWGHTLRSPHPHARIRSIDTAKAVATSGVYAVLLAGDLPGKKTYGLEFADQPVLAWDRVRYAGEPVALVAAVDAETARRAAGKIAVDYEVLPAVTDMEQALDPGAPQVHEFGNVLRHIHIVHGDPDARADVWVEGYYETGMQDQAMLGPESGLAVPGDEEFVEARRLLSVEPLQAEVIQDEHVRSQEGAKGLLLGMVTPGLCQRPEESVSSYKADAVSSAHCGIAKSLRQERFAYANRAHEEHMLMAVQELQGEDCIQQAPVKGNTGFPVEIFQPANLFESRQPQVDFQVMVITAAYLISQDYLQEGSIVQLVPPGQGKPFGQDVQQVAQPETLEQWFKFTGSCHAVLLNFGHHGGYLHYHLR